MLAAAEKKYVLLTYVLPTSNQEMPAHLIKFTTASCGRLWAVHKKNERKMSLKLIKGRCSLKEYKSFIQAPVYFKRPAGYHTCHKRSLLAATFLFLTRCHRLPQIATDCHRLPQIVTDCHRLPQCRNGCHGMPFTQLKFATMQLIAQFTHFVIWKFAQITFGDSYCIYRACKVLLFGQIHIARSHGSTAEAG